MGFSLSGIHFSYDGNPVIRGISHDFVPGRFHGILGPNGCGKTTLLDLLVSHRRQDRGEITWKGNSLSSMGRMELARQVALVSQDYYINFPYTAQEVVMMGRHPHIPRFASPSSEDFRVVDRVMEITGVSEFKDASITELSGGERQRTVFARALAQDTRVLILDEATSNLDINHTLALLDIVRERVRKQNLTVISVFQDINLAAVYCDHILCMKEGKKAAAGTSLEIMDTGILKTVFDVNSSVRFEPLYNARQAVFLTGDM